MSAITLRLVERCTARDHSAHRSAVEVARLVEDIRPGDGDPALQPYWAGELAWLQSEVLPRLERLQARTKKAVDNARKLYDAEVAAVCAVAEGDDEEAFAQTMLNRLRMITS